MARQCRWALALCLLAAASLAQGQIFGTAPPTGTTSPTSAPTATPYSTRAPASAAPPPPPATAPAAASPAAPPAAPPASSNTGAIAGGVVGSVALLALLAAAAYFVQRRRRATAKDAGLPTVAPAARGGNVASAPGPGTEDKDSAFAWQERTLLPASMPNSQQISSKSSSLHVSVDSAEAAAAADAANEKFALSQRLVDQPLRPEDIQLADGPDGKPFLLGKGGFGEVYLARWNYTEVAVKVLHVGENPRQQEEFRREAELLRALRHPNVVMYLGSCLVPGQQNMVIMEYAAGGTLSSRLATDGVGGQPRRFGWYGRGRVIAHGVATGLAYLHARQIIHFDIKSSNVLLDRAGLTAKIADVGLSKIARGSQVSQTMRGTESYLAPELYGYGSEKCTNKADVYSFGVLLAEIITGDPPSKRFGLREPIVPDECPQEAVDLYRRCISTSPQARPNASELVQRLEQLRLIKAHTAPASTERDAQTPLISPLPTPGALNPVATAAPAERPGEAVGGHGEARDEAVGDNARPPRGPFEASRAPAAAQGEAPGAGRGPDGGPNEGHLAVQSRRSAPSHPAGSPSPAESRLAGRATYSGPGEQGPGPARPGVGGVAGPALPTPADAPLTRVSVDSDDRAAKVLQAMQERAAAREAAKGSPRVL